MTEKPKFKNACYIMVFRVTVLATVTNNGGMNNLGRYHHYTPLHAFTQTDSSETASLLFLFPSQNLHVDVAIDSSNLFLIV